MFAPSLFIGAMAGMAFGEAAHSVFGPSIGPPALYAVVAMGGVFAATAHAPLTAIASVVEMTGNDALTVPMMLTCAIAAAVSKRLSYGSVYTTKLLRRGIDIERPKPTASCTRSPSARSCNRSSRPTEKPDCSQHASGSERAQTPPGQKRCPDK